MSPTLVAAPPPSRRHRSSLFASLLLLVAAAAPSAAQDEPKVVRPSADKVDEHFLGRRWAQSDLARLTDALRRYKNDHAGFPAGDVAPALEPDYLAPAPKADPWGTPYRFELDGAKANVSSAGPDKVFGNADDLKVGVFDAPTLQDAREVTPAVTAATSSKAPPHRDPALPEVPAEQASTFDRMQRMADALEAHRLERGFYPVAADTDALKTKLVPRHLASADWPNTDGWGKVWRYRVTDDGRSYTLVSAGSDGEFEDLAPLQSGPVGAPARDLVLSNNSFQRWPAGTGGNRADADGSLRSRSVANDSMPATPALTRPTHAGAASRLQGVASAIEQYRRDHATYPEFDDCQRLADVLGGNVSCSDAWGRPIAYLTVASGSSYVLVSAGPDGRLQASAEDYVRGAKRAGDDVVLLRGKLLE